MENEMRKTAVIVSVLAILVAVPCHSIAINEVDVTVSANSSLEKPVAAGFDRWEGAQPLQINIYAANPMDIASASVYLYEAVIWHPADESAPDPWIFETASILPDEAFAVVLKGSLKRSGGGGGGGGVTPDWAAAVSDIDIDADTDNSGELAGTPARRSPSDDASQRAQEDAREVTDNSDGEGGMVLGPDEDWANVKLKLHAKVKGTLSVTTDDSSKIQIKTDTGAVVQDEEVGPGPVTRDYLVKANTSDPTVLPVTIKATFTPLSSAVSGTPVGTVEDEFLAHVRKVCITHCPDFFVPGHENIIKYRISPSGYTATYAKIEIFERDTNGDPTGAAVYSYTGDNLAKTGGSEHSFTYSGTDVSENPGRYVVKLSAGDSEETAASDKAGFDVKVWDLVAMFWDRLSDEEKAAMDAAFEDSGEYPDYDPDSDPLFVGGTEVTAVDEYVSGIDVSTVTSSTVTIERWYWDETYGDAEALSIESVSGTEDMSESQWEARWGDKDWYDQRKSALVETNGEVYSMSEETQYYYVKCVVTSDGVFDLVENTYDGNEDTSDMERTVTYKLRLDGDGYAEILEEIWE